MTWSSIEHEVSLLSLPSSQAGNVADLIGALAGLEAPKGVWSNLYDGGLSLDWDKFEIATFDDRYETYEFEDGRTDIKHWSHRPGEPMPEGLLADARTFTLRVPK